MAEGWDEDGLQAVRGALRGAAVFTRRDRAGTGWLGAYTAIRL